MLDDILNDIPLSQSISDVTQDIDIGVLPNWNEDDNLPKKDIFAVEQRKAWDKSVEARCDFTPKLRLTRRASTWGCSRRQSASVRTPQRWNQSVRAAVRWYQPSDQP